jgi:hypothetical protein
MHRRTLESKFRASPNGALPSATAGPSTSTVTIWEEGGASLHKLGIDGLRLDSKPVTCCST